MTVGPPHLLPLKLHPLPLLVLETEWFGVWRQLPLTETLLKNPPAMLETQETQVGSLHWNDPLEEGMAIH